MKTSTVIHDTLTVGQCTISFQKTVKAEKNIVYLRLFFGENNRQKNLSRSIRI